MGRQETAGTARNGDGDISVAELQLATRNSGMPLEALDWAVTPGADGCGHDGVRRQRARAPRAATAEPTVARRGGGDGGVDGHAAATVARGRGPARRRDRDRVHRP